MKIPTIDDHVVDYLHGPFEVDDVELRSDAGVAGGSAVVLR